MYQGPEFRHLEYFLAVAEETTFSKAARRLHVTQPALSRQIQQLEDGVGTKLFARTQSGVLLTPAGNAFLSHAKAMLRMRQEAIDHTSFVGSGLESPFRLGYSPWVAPEFVHEVFIGYRELMPDGVLEPTSKDSGALVRMVLDGQLRAALVHLPVGERGLYIQPVCSEKLMLCMKADDPLAGEGSIARTAVGDQLRIMFVRELYPHLYDTIERKLAKAGIRLRPRHFVLHPADAQFLVKEQGGWTLMREDAAIDPALVLRPISGVSLNIRSAFVCLPVQERPVLPLLAYRVAKVCVARDAAQSERKPVSRVTPTKNTQKRLFG